MERQRLQHTVERGQPSLPPIPAATSRRYDEVYVEVDRGKWDAPLRKAVFARLCEGHEVLAKQTSRPSRDLLGLVAELGEADRPAALQIAAIDDHLSLMGRQVNNIIRKTQDTEQRQRIERAALQVAFCPPATVRIRNPWRTVRCWRYWVCPWCRYAAGERVLAELSDRLHNSEMIHSVRIDQCVENAHWPVAGAQKSLIESLCTEHRTWSCDAAITVPRYDRQESLWYLRTTIIALGPRSAVLIKPERCFDWRTARWMPAFFGQEGWRSVRKGARSLAKLVREAVDYSPELMYIERNHPRFLGFAMLSVDLPVLFHGFEPAEKMPVRSCF